MEASTAVRDDETVVGLYRVALIVGNEGTPGAPLLELQLVVDAPSGRISGQAVITQAIAPPEGRIVVSNLTGQIRSLGFGPAVRVVSLEGSYEHFLAPPAIGVATLPFSATLLIPQACWDGRGSFSYGGRDVDDVPVAAEND